MSNSPRRTAPLAEALPFPVSIIGNRPLVALELAPGDIALVCEFRRNPATDSDLKPATVPI